MGTCPCPHCAASSIPANDVFVRAVVLRGAEWPNRCTKCDGLSYLPMNGTSAKLALGVVGIGTLLSLPPLVRALFPGLSGLTLGAIPLLVWSATIWIAIGTLILGGDLQKLDAAVAPRIRPERTLLLAAMAAYFGYLAWNLKSAI